MKLNLKQTFITLKGEELKEKDEAITLGEVLANIVLSPHENKNGFRPLKAWELAQKLNKYEEIELDQSDLTQIKDIIENTSSALPLIKGQILEMFANAEKSE